jgi:hypothetical protein
MKSLAHQLEDTGYVFIRSLLSSDEVRFYRTKMEDLSGIRDSDFALDGGRALRWCRPDGVNQIRDCWGLIEHERLLSLVKDILGPQVRYTQLPIYKSTTTELVGTVTT